MSELFVVTVVSEGPSPVQLLFFAKEHAQKAYAALVGKDRGENEFEIEVEDDYGTRLLVNRDRTLTIQFSDMRRAQEGQGEAQLMGHRASAALQKRAMADPTLKILAPNMPPNGMLRA